MITCKPVTRRGLPLAGWVALLIDCLGSRADALQFVPLTVSPVRAGVFLLELGGTQACSDGPSSASLIQGFSGPSVSGTAQVSVTTSTNGYSVHVTGSANGSAGQSVALFAFAEFDIAVPELGDAMTPVVVSLEDVSRTESGMAIDGISVWGQKLVAAGCQAYEIGGLSTQLGAGIGPIYGEALASIRYGSGPMITSVVPPSYPAGDTVRIHLAAILEPTLTAASGTFDESFRVAFRTSAPAIGNGDLNGDRSVDIVDSAILRRKLAGLPAN